MSAPLIPVTDEQAKAIGEALKIVNGLGSFLEKALGSTPEDIVGYLGGDWLKVKRAENMVRMMEQARKKLEDRHVDAKPAPLTLAIPLLRDAADESREELVNLWAELLAAASDPARVDQVRPEYLDIVKLLAVDDVKVLRKLAPIRGVTMPNSFDSLADSIGISRDRFRISIDKLKTLDLVIAPNGAAHMLSALGREFMRTVGEPNVAQP